MGKNLHAEDEGVAGDPGVVDEHRHLRFYRELTVYRESAANSKRVGSVRIALPPELANVCDRRFRFHEKIK
jgi:hypothetical protein